jgi:hypothetical protein
VTESLRIEARRPAAAPRPPATPEADARTALDGDGSGVCPDPGHLKAIIEHILGREIKLSRTDRRDGSSGRADAGLGAVQVNATATPFSLRNGTSEALGQVRASSVYVTQAGGVGAIPQVDLVA